jgi:hypothetical protein
MRRLFLIACLLLGAALPAAGQGGFTTVSGTIVGAVDGLTWSCGTITAQLITAGGVSPTLNGGGFSTSVSPVTLGCPTSPGTGAPGSFTMRLADSGQISPSTTTWQFTVNMTPGIAPPAGTGPQSFTYTTAINCSTNTPSTCTANAMSISAQLSALAPKLSNASGGTGTGFPVTTNVTVNSGGSISLNGGTIQTAIPVSVLPGTCTAGFVYQLPGGATYTCGPNNTFASNVVTGTVDPTAFGAKEDTQSAVSPNITTSNGSPTVVITTANFCNGTTVPCSAGQTNSVGQNIFCTSWNQNDANYPTSALTLGSSTQGASGATTILSVTSSTTVTASRNATAASSQCYWGTDDGANTTTSPLALAWNSTANVNTSCQTLVIGRPTWTSAPQFNSASCPVDITGPSHYAAVAGTSEPGLGGAKFVIPPNFQWTLCPTSPVNACFMDFRGAGLTNIGFVGGGHQAGPAGGFLLQGQTDGTYENIMCGGIAATNGGTTWGGFATGAGYHIIKNVIMDGCGTRPIDFNGALGNDVFDVFGGNSGGFSTVDPGANVGCYGCDFQTSVTTVVEGLDISGTYTGYRDAVAVPQTVNNSSFVVESGGLAILNHPLALNPGGAASVAVNVLAGGKAVINGGQFSGGSSGGGCFKTAATGTLLLYGGPNCAGTLWASPPTIAATGNGTIALAANSSNEVGSFTLTAGTTTGTTPAITLTFAGAFTLNTKAPQCTLSLLNGTVNGVTFTGTWAPTSIIQTAGTTALVTWTVTATALVSGSTYGGSYICAAQ